MKIYKQKISYYPFSLLIYGGLFLLALFAPHFVAQHLSLSSIFLIILVLLCLHPLSKTKLNTHTTANNNNFNRKSGWIIKLIIFQLLIYLNFFAVIYIFLKPLNQAQHYDPIPVLAEHAFLWGFIPWCVITLAAVCLAYVYYVKSQPGFLETAIEKLTSNTMNHWVKSFIQIPLNIINYLSISFISGLYCLGLAYLLCSMFNINFLSGSQTVTFFIVLPLIFIAASKGFAKTCQFISNKKLPYNMTSILAMLTISLIIFALQIFAHGLSLLQPEKLNHHFSGVFDKKLNADTWLIFAWGSWMCILNLSASYMASLFQGQRIRHVLSISLIIPGIISLILFLYPSCLYYINNSNIFLLGFFSFIFIQYKLKDQITVVYGFLANRDNIKQRPTQRFIKASVGGILLLCVIMLFSGMSLIYAFSFNACILPAIFVLLAVAGIIKQSSPVLPLSSESEL